MKSHSLFDIFYHISTTIFISVFGIFISGLFFIQTPIALAQFNSALPTAINIDISPTAPKPNDTVTVVISSYATDLNGATITWKINGKKISSGKGLKDLSFVVGPTNTTTTLSLTILTTEGETIQKNYTIKPTSVDLIWQATGYTPPFYKGKTLFSHQDIIEFIALPHVFSSKGVEIPPQNLIYTWTRNGTVVGDFSGFGKYTYTVQSSIISRALDVQVQVTSPTTDSIGSAEVVVPPLEPEIVFYEKNPLYGIQFQRALTDEVTLNSSKEIEIVGEPYFFGTKDPKDNSLSYKWNINNTSIGGDMTQQSRVFRQADGTSGTSFISLSIENTKQILQSASAGFNLVFKKNQSNQTTL